jgi:predicted alpha/beta-fold hydrolase
MLKPTLRLARSSRIAINCKYLAFTAFAISTTRALAKAHNVAGSWRTLRILLPIFPRITLALMSDFTRSLLLHLQLISPTSARIMEPTIEKSDPSGMLTGISLEYTPPECARSAVTQSVLALQRGKIDKYTTLDFIEPLTLPDGGRVALAWSRQSDCLPADAPVALMLHGLAGNEKVGYVRRFAHRAISYGFRPVLMVRRGHGDLSIEVPDRSISETLENDVLKNCERCSLDAKRMWPRYSESYDLRQVVKHLKHDRLRSDVQLVAVGFSAGSNMLAKALGEPGEAADELNRNVCAAVSLANGFDIASGEPLLRSSAPDLNALLTLLVKRMYRRNERAIVSETSKSFSQSSHQHYKRRILQCSTLRELDENTAVPMYGYKSADEYYEASSCKDELCNVRTPLCIINARDDPFINEELLDLARSAVRQNSEYLSLLISSHGGHMAWVQKGSDTSSWSDDISLQFLFNQLQRQREGRSDKRDVPTKE